MNLRQPFYLAVFVLLNQLFLFGPNGLAAQDVVQKNVKRPTEKNMLVLSAGGSQWGPTENIFGTHQFLLKGNQGNALWRDSDPTSMVLLSDENKTYFVYPLEEHLQEHTKHGGLTQNYTTKNKEIKLPDGRTAVLTTFEYLDRQGVSTKFQEVLSFKDVTLSPAMLKVWCALLNSKPELGFPIALETMGAGGRHHRSSHRHGTSSPRQLVLYRSIQFVPTKSELFKIPKGYKRATDKSAFYFSHDGDLHSSDLDDLFGRTPK